MRDVGRLAEREHDLLVIGGGIHGAGIARDAAIRGLSVALVERDDFGCGTTSASSRLAHGGIRYLTQLNLGLVAEALRERGILMRIAPHLVQPIPFLFPIYGRLGPAVRLVLWGYHALAPSGTVPPYRFVRPEEASLLEPGLVLEGMKGAARFFDGQILFPERLCLENVLDAAAHGAMVANHAPATRLLVEGGRRVAGAEIEDGRTGKRYEVRAKLTVNASGPWLDALLPGLPRPRRSYLRRTKGIHLVTDRLLDHALVFRTKDNRYVFVIPWDDFSLVGTTDTDYRGDPAVAAADASDVDYVVREVSAVVPALREARIHYTTAGVRSLRPVTGVRESSVTRSLELYDHAKDGADGLWSLLGGKLTTYRATAALVVDRAMRRLGRKGRSTTADRPLPGAPVGDLGAFLSRASALSAAHGVSSDSAREALRLFGARAGAVLSASETDADRRPICAHTPEVLATARFAALHEFAVTPSDVLLRRCLCGQRSCQGLDALPAVSRLLADVHGFAPDEVRRGEREYREYTARRVAALGAQRRDK